MRLGVETPLEKSVEGGVRGSRISLAIDGPRNNTQIRAGGNGCGNVDEIDW